MPNAVAEVTSYVYGALPNDNPYEYMPTDSVRAVVYPGSFYSTQTDSFTGSDIVYYDYDQIGEMTSMTDQNGTTQNHNGYDESTADVNGINTSVTGDRPTTLQYPTTGTTSSRVLTYSYGTTGGGSNEINRLDSIYDGPVTPADELASYAYLGPDTIVTEDYTQPQIGLDYTGDVGDSYTGLDQYNRVIDQVWAGYGSNASAGKLDEYKYGYNPQGNVAYRQNVTAAAADLDQIYGYDDLGQLISMAQGGLTFSGGNPTLTSGSGTMAQNWTLDGMGNWSSFGQSGTGVATVSQTRQTNSANQITGYYNSSGQNTSDWAVPTYDANGNMTFTPGPVDETDGLQCTYDAWNRLVHATDGDNSSTGIDVSYSYDGLGRMITRTNNNAAPTSAAITDYYYAGQQMLESDQRAPATLNDGETRTTQQYVWSARYVDSPIESDTTTSTYSSGTWTAGLPVRDYYLTDADNNVTAVTNASGVVQERYSYDAYGNVTMYNGPTSPGGDWSDPHTVSTQGTTRLFGGMQQDPATGLYYDRARWYDPSTGGFMSQDPAQSDPNLYRYAGNDPTSFNDPSGMSGGPVSGESGQSGGMPGPQGPTPTCAPSQAPAHTGALPTGGDALPADQPGAGDFTGDDGPGGGGEFGGENNEYDQYLAEQREFVQGVLGSNLNNVPQSAIDQIAARYPSLVNMNLYGPQAGTLTVSAPGPLGGTGTSYTFESANWFWESPYYRLVTQQSEASPGATYMAGRPRRTKASIAKPRSSSMSAQAQRPLRRPPSCTPAQ